MENFITDYFIDPIWSKTGYNVVNTLVYAIIAIGSVYLISRVLKGKIAIDENFVKSILAFVLLGSTLRSLTDAIDNNVFQAVSPIHEFVLDSGIYAYGYLTVSPGIYLVTAGLLFISMAILYRIKRMDLLAWVGIGLWLPHFLLLLPFMEYLVYSLPIFILAAIPAYIAYRYCKDKIYTAVVAGQALDGAATFFVIDFFSKISGIQYFEQHVFSAAIGNFGGTFFVFYLVKCAIAFAAIHVLREEKMDQEDKYFIALVLMIMGFAPGIRDILRMVLGA
ncbi:DUF63 family protein [Candidatus Micrarchaeota archaeon]|nr:DUF63 family protein [Candidatus Micrarchaeota archaeon]MBU1681205.1 DUF63 family protein [Candidatus Micrarchaeota archaeon]